MTLNALLFVLALLITDPTRIGQINKLKAEARKAFLAEDYETAARHYRYLTDSLALKEDEVLLNLAHAQYHLRDTAQAMLNYQQASLSSKPVIRSTAHQQMGVIKNRQGKFDEALNHFREAIKADPGNDDARYNYELLKRKLDEQKKQEQQQKDQQKDKQQDQQQKDQQKKEDQKKEQDKKDQEKKDQEKQNDKQDKPDDKKDQQQQQQDQQQQEEEQKKENKPSSEKLEQMKISEEKARMILEALKNQEIQYLQQNKRKATQPKDKNKPDW